MSFSLTLQIAPMPLVHVLSNIFRQYNFNLLRAHVQINVQRSEADQSHREYSQVSQRYQFGTDGISCPVKSLKWATAPFLGTSGT
ncbi:hypothetical protein TNCV_103751 [Trichonephila clavipes]|nr:hypothetical protein TNCV_103751 [Trichonephila clavipes]